MARICLRRKPAGVLQQQGFSGSDCEQARFLKGRAQFEGVARMERSEIGPAHLQSASRISQALNQDAIRHLVGAG
jgi:hypothetical protein